MIGPLLALLTMASGCARDQTWLTLDLSSQGVLTWCLDQDDDGFGDSTQCLPAIEPPDDYTDQAGDCDDANPDAWPGAPESCDGWDSDCDGIADPPACLCDEGLCPCEILGHGERIYAFCDSLALPWEGADAWCAGNLDMGLAAISDLDENYVVGALISAFGAGDPWWIGLGDPDGDGSWTWVDGSSLDQEEAAWAPGEPGDDGATTCATLFAGTWWATSCDLAFPFVCEGPAP